MKKLILLGICLFLAIPSQAGIIYVDANANGLNTGSSWANAYNYLQNALAEANSATKPVEIRVAQGTYKPDQGAGITAGDRTATLQLINGVTLKGGYAGEGEPDPNARDVELYETILTGDLNGDDIELTNPADMWGEQSRYDNSNHVVTGSDKDANAILDGFTITAGYNGGLGAGMYNRDGNPTVTNCTFTWNCAEWGGGMGNWNSSPKVINCKFESNAAAGGGGIDNVENSNPILINCTFSGNSGFWRGGGMLNGYAGVGGSANPILINCIFSGNSTDRYGGGMYNEYSSPIITNCTFTGNAAERGGGMYNWDSSPSLINCRFLKNSAEYGGGMLNDNNSSPTVRNCTFSENSTGYTGGGMHNWNSSPIVTCCTFSSNSTMHAGGGMYTVQGEPNLTNCTFIANTAPNGGGGGMFNATSSPTLTNCTFSGNSANYGGGITSGVETHTAIANCILWGNTAASGNDVVLGGSHGVSTATISYSNIKGGLAEVLVDSGCTLDWSESNINADPCFFVPGYWDANCTPVPPPPGPPPPPSPPPPGPPCYWIDGDYHLLPDSPCIDAGDPNYVAEPNETDLDGRPRIIGGRIDMGAYEYSPIQAEVRIVPRTINLASKGNWITCYISLPEDYNVADIDPNSILLEYEIKAESLRIDEQQQVAIAKFSRSEVQGILNIGEVELSIIGWLTDRTLFEGRDIIRVINKEGGGKPDKYVQASDPNPPDGVTVVGINADLSWVSGPYVTSHDVYFGTSSLPPFVCNQTDTTFDPGTMADNTKYYWRIDEVNKWGKTIGEVWSFTIMLFPPPPPPPPPPP